MKRKKSCKLSCSVEIESAVFIRGVIINILLLAMRELLFHQENAEKKNY